MHLLASWIYVNHANDRRTYSGVRPIAPNTLLSVNITRVYGGIESTNYRLESAERKIIMM